MSCALSRASPDSETSLRVPRVVAAGEQLDDTERNTARLLQKTNTLPLGEGLAELCVSVLFFFSPFPFQIFF